MKECYNQINHHLKQIIIIIVIIIIIMITGERISSYSYAAIKGNSVIDINQNYEKLALEYSQRQFTGCVHASVK